MRLLYLISRCTTNPCLTVKKCFPCVKNLNAGASVSSVFLDLGLFDQRLITVNKSVLVLDPQPIVLENPEALNNPLSSNLATDNLKSPS